MRAGGKQTLGCRLTAPGKIPELAANAPAIPPLKGKEGVGERGTERAFSSFFLLPSMIKMRKEANMVSNAGLPISLMIAETTQL